MLLSGLESPGRCDFEAGGLCHWQNMTDDAFDWQRVSGRTPSLFTGPSYDHTIGFTGQGNSDPLVVNNEPPLLWQSKASFAMANQNSHEIAILCFCNGDSKLNRDRHPVFGTSTGKIGPAIMYSVRCMLVLISVTKCPNNRPLNFSINCAEKYRQWRS